MEPPQRRIQYFCLPVSLWDLLEPCAVNSCLHGSEGAGTQKRVPATRLVVGKEGKIAVITLVDRQSRFTVILALPQGRAADHVADVLIDHMWGLPELVRKSLT